MMMFRFYSIFFIFFSFSILFGQTYIYKGKLGQKQGTLILKIDKTDKKNPVYEGYFYFESQQKPIFLKLESLNKSSLKLTNPDSEPPITLSGTISKNSFKGVMKEDRSSYSFNLKIDETLKLADYNFYEDLTLRIKGGKHMVLEYFSGISIFKDERKQAQILSYLYKNGNVRNVGEYQRKIYADLVNNFGFNDPQLRSKVDESLPTTYVNIDILPFIVQKDFMVYDTYFYQFTGQGHAIYGVSFINYDLRNNEVIDNYTFFNRDKHKEIEDLLNQKIRENLDISPDQSLEDADIPDNCFIVKEVPFTYNFYINDYGVTFIFNPYEVTSFTCGTYEVMLSWEDLKGMSNFKL